MLTMQITLHTNTGAHSGTCSGFTHTHIHIYVCMYVRTHMDTQCCHHLAVRLSDAVRQAGSRGCKAGRQGGREATRAKNPTNASACTAKVKLNGLAVHSSRPTHTQGRHTHAHFCTLSYIARERERESVRGDWASACQGSSSTSRLN